MTLLRALPTTLTHRGQGLSTSQGWVGLDIAGNSMRLAQIERRDGRYRFVHRWHCCLTERALAQDKPEELLRPNVNELAKIRKMFRAAKCAATLPQAVATLRSFELPQAPDSEMREMVSQELAAEAEQLPQDYRFAFWSRPNTNSQLTNVTAITVPARVARQVVNDLARCGFDCEVLDGLPCALARAAAMANDSAEPAAILDLSDTSMTCVVAAGGTPVFTRVLRGGGLLSLLAQLRETLQLTHEQSLQLMSYCPATSVDRQADTLSTVALQLLENPLAQLLDELSRTLTYVAQQYAEFAPARLWLVGEGTRIEWLPKYFSGKLHMPVELWRLPATRQMLAEDARYAVAAALSILRWEQSSCT